MSREAGGGRERQLVNDVGNGVIVSFNLPLFSLWFTSVLSSWLHLCLAVH